MASSEDRGLRPKQAAHQLNVSLSTLAKWRMKGEGPPYHRCGPRLVLYFQTEIEAWLTQRRNKPAKPDSAASQVA